MAEKKRSRVSVWDMVKGQFETSDQKSYDAYLDSVENRKKNEEEWKRREEEAKRRQGVKSKKDLGY